MRGPLRLQAAAFMSPRLITAQAEMPIPKRWPNEQRGISEPAEAEEVLEFQSGQRPGAAAAAGGAGLWWVTGVVVPLVCAVIAAVSVVVSSVLTKPATTTVNVSVQIGPGYVSVDTDTDGEGEKRRLHGTRLRS